MCRCSDPRKPADDAANYVTTLAPYLDCPTALQSGWPTATGILEGACRHLVKHDAETTSKRSQPTGFENAFNEDANFPCSATVVGETIEVLSVAATTTDAN